MPVEREVETSTPAGKGVAHDAQPSVDTERWPAERAVELPAVTEEAHEERVRSPRAKLGHGLLHESWPAGAKAPLRSQDSTNCAGERLPAPAKNLVPHGEVHGPESNDLPDLSEEARDAA